MNLQLKWPIRCQLRALSRSSDPSSTPSAWNLSSREIKQSMVPQSVRGCLREADARGPAFSRDLHSVTAVTLSFLRPRLTSTTFQELTNQGYLHILGLLLLPEGPLVYWSTKFVSSVPSTLWGGGAVPPLGPTPHLMHMQVYSPAPLFTYTFTACTESKEWLRPLL